MFAASMAPSAAPAPMRVCTSSMKRMMSSSALTSSMSFLRRSSNSPRYLVPATSRPMSRVIMRLPSSVSGTSLAAIFCASPSAMADLPTPGSPMRHGLFLVRRPRICVTRMISLARPMQGSSLASSACLVRSDPNSSSVGVLDPPAAPPAPGRGSDSLLGLANHADHLGANLGGIRVEVLEHAGGDALALAEEAEEKVFSADVVVAELPRLFKRELEDALGAGGEGDLHRDKAGAAADDLLNLDARLLEGDAP